MTTAMRHRFTFGVLLSFIFGAFCGSVPQEACSTERPPPQENAPVTRVGVWTDALGFLVGFRMAGVEYALAPRTSLGVLLTQTGLELDGVKAGGVGWGVTADYYLTGKALSSGAVLGGMLLFLPLDFEDRLQSPVLTGEIFGLGAQLSIGYRFVMGAISIRPMVSLAYLNFPETIYLSGGVTPQARNIDKIHGTVPAAHLQIGVVF